MSSKPEDHLLYLDGVGLTYGPPHNLTVLNDVSMHVAAREMVAICGPSGAGKSSLLNVLGLLQRPSIGHYRVDQMDTQTMAESQLSALRARTFGFVFQSFHLLAGRSALANIELGMLYTAERRDRIKRAVQAAETVGIDHRLSHHPDELSGGERQRVAIARALAPCPRVVFADEPTGNLDSSSAAQVMSSLASVREQGTAVVVVTHASEIARQCDRTIWINDGRIVTSPPRA